MFTALMVSGLKQREIVRTNPICQLPRPQRPVMVSVCKCVRSEVGGGCVIVLSSPEVCEGVSLWVGVGVSGSGPLPQAEHTLLISLMCV